jgi:hypothetical protein
MAKRRKVLRPIIGTLRSARAEQIALRMLTDAKSFQSHPSLATRLVRLQAKQGGATAQ